MKTILITGVSKGLGLEITKNLLSKNYNVFGISRNETIDITNLKSIYPNNFTFINLDLSDTTNLLSVFKNKLPSKIKFDGFINNAAQAYDDIITNMNLDKLKVMYDINVFSPLILTKFIIRNMLLNKTEGSIVHISSISVHTGYKGLSMYASTKGALEAFSKNTSREWGEKGIRSNCVVAGFMETEMSSTLNDETINRIEKRTSLKKLTSLQSVAETVEFLLSDKSNSITGQLINVDSGTI